MTQPQQPSVEELKECREAFEKHWAAQSDTKRIGHERKAWHYRQWETAWQAAWNRRTSPSPAEVGSYGLLPIEAERKAAEESYTISAFDYPAAPIGHRDWVLYFAGWLARSTHPIGRQALANLQAVTAPGVGLTDEEIETIAADYWRTVHTLTGQTGSFAYGLFARAIERALNQRLAVKDGKVFDADCPKFRVAFEEALAAGNWPMTRNGDGYRSPMTQMAWQVAFSTVNRLKLYTHPVSDDQQAKDAWKPIETAPRDGTRLLVGIADGMAVIAWFEGDRWWKRAGSYLPYDPTHWMPLPAQPLSTTKQEEA